MLRRGQEGTGAPRRVRPNHTHRGEREGRAHRTQGPAASGPGARYLVLGIGEGRVVPGDGRRRPSRAGGANCGRIPAF